MPSNLQLLVAAKHALRSYANGNASPELATQISDQLEAAINGFPKDFGLTMAQEPKYTICQFTGRIINRATGIAIPDDEPIMIFRAKDVRARLPLRTYADSVVESGDRGHHKNVCFERYQRFVDFAEQHPERMAEPTS